MKERDMTHNREIEVRKQLNAIATLAHVAANIDIQLDTTRGYEFLDEAFGVLTSAMNILRFKIGHVHDRSQ